MLLQLNFDWYLFVFVVHPRCVVACFVLVWAFSPTGIGLSFVVVLVDSSPCAFTLDLVNLIGVCFENIVH